MNAQPPPDAGWPKRSHTCGELRAEHSGSAVVLNGWVHRRRDQGGLIFLDLRDRYGITQVVVNRATSSEAHEIASSVRSEFVVAARGEVRARPNGTANPGLATGQIEVAAAAIDILAPSAPLPFEVTSGADVDESLRLEYRYLDLRRRRMLELTELRFRITRIMREFLWARGFLELETPTLVKSTPEGARDFVVPSRHHPGHFYALPQSPQQLKQLLMVGGLDRYFQLARAYRDEDLRADRSAEHTQLDIEMAFVEREDVLSLIQELYVVITDQLSEKSRLEDPFPRLTYAEALDRFGTDVPDLRFGLELSDVSEAVRGAGFRIFDNALAAGGRVKSIVVPGGASRSRKQIDRLTDIVKEGGAKGMVTIALAADGSVRSPLERFLGEAAVVELARSAGAEQGDLVCMVADRPEIVGAALAELRVHLGAALGLIDPDVLAFAWIIDFPLFEQIENEEGFTFSHNPFCAPADDSFELLYSDPGKALSKQYDLICNGHEIGGGSIRAHRAKDLRRIYEVMGNDPASTEEQVGHMLRAFEYGAPPHGGIAMGVDRIAMILGDTENLRDVTVFPKNQAGLDLMLGAPSPITDDQLEELHIRLRDQPSAS